MAFPSKLLNEGEHVVVSTRTHPKALLLPVLILVLTLGVAAYAQRTGGGTAAGVMHVAVWVVAAVVILLWVVRPAVAWATNSACPCSPLPAGATGPRYSARSSA